MRSAFLSALIFLFTTAIHSQTEPASSFRPKGGFVPNAETAVKTAEAVLMPVYGEKKILSERPFKARLEEDVWTVSGTLRCAPPATNCPGGTATVKISKNTGEILKMMHYK